MTTTAELDGLIEELTVDAYNDEEQLSGFLVGSEEALIRGEQATIAGAAVKVLLGIVMFEVGTTACTGPGVTA